MDRDVDMGLILMEIHAQARAKAEAPRPAPNGGLAWWPAPWRQSFRCGKVNNLDVVRVWLAAERRMTLTPAQRAVALVLSAMPGFEAA